MTPLLLETEFESTLSVNRIKVPVSQRTKLRAHCLDASNVWNDVIDSKQVLVLSQVGR